MARKKNGLLKKAYKAVEKGVARRRVKRLAKKGAVSSVDISKARKNKPVKASTYSRKGMKSQEKAVPGMSKTGRVRKGAKGAVKTKGGTYAKYDKKSKAAGSFRSAFKKGCAGGAKSFSWDGRSYSCAKKSDTKKAAPKAAAKPHPSDKPGKKTGHPVPRRKTKSVWKGGRWHRNQPA